MCAAAGQYGHLDVKMVRSTDREDKCPWNEQTASPKLTVTWNSEWAWNNGCDYEPRAA